MTYLRVLTLTLLALGAAGLASAQATRTWVSGVGDDVNPCSRTAPCKTFAGAISKTADGGTINCLDSGGFGAVTITKSINIDCTGVVGSILAAGVNGITINASATNGQVILRNIQINGVLPTNAGAAANGLSGIRYLAAKSVHVEGVHIAGFANNCVDVAATAAGQLTVVDSILEHCGTNGLNVSTTVGQVNAQVRDTKILGSTTSGVTSTGTAVNAGAGSRIVLDRVMIADVVTGVSQGASGANVFVVGSSIHNAATALRSVAGAIMGATQSGFYNCGTIFNINGGSLFTGGDNTKFNEAVVGATSGTLSKV